MAKTIREAVTESIRWHGDSDFWRNQLSDELCRIHTRNSLRPDDYLDDMTWAEHRRARGYVPSQRARLDMSIEAL